MPFSMTTYFAGVGTVVGALALGFGGGIVLTDTAIKDTPAGPTRIERVMRSEPIAALQVVKAKAIPMPYVDPAGWTGSSDPAAAVSRRGSKRGSA
jgi:hypothetical protein